MEKRCQWCARDRGDLPNMRVRYDTSGSECRIQRNKNQCSDDSGCGKLC